MGVATKQKEHLLDRYFKQLVFNGTPPVYIYLKKKCNWSNSVKKSTTKKIILLFLKK